MIPPLIQDAVQELRAFQDEDDISKKFKKKTTAVISILESQCPLCVEKALAALEELNSLEISPYYRTQIWSIISLLESIPK